MSAKQRLASVNAVFAKALLHHQAGRLSEAEALYRRVLADNGRHADSLHLLGVIEAQGERHEAAVKLIGKAIAINGRVAAYHSNLGNTLRQLGRSEEAVACCRRAINLQPDFAEAHHNLGVALDSLGRGDEAVACYRRAIALRPDFADPHHNLGIALKEQGHVEEAVACYRRAIELRPDLPDVHCNLGIALTDQGHLDEAIACYRRAMELRPDFAYAQNNLGNTLVQQVHLDEAIACYRRAIDFKPDFADAHHNLAMALLMRGEMEEGWKEYEWRWKTPQMSRKNRSFAQPQWRGEAGEGRTLLIHAEQGFGDTVQFCRYATLAAARGLRVVMEVKTPLVRLLRCLPGVDQVVARGTDLPPFDLHCPMLSLPLALGTTMATIPSAASYLVADAGQVAAWGTRLAALPRQGLRIGLVWAGSSRLKTDRRRSIAPDRLAPLFALQGLHLFSLQKGGAAAPEGFALTDLMDEVDDFADTAALIANLDLVITVDTAVAHLAAALGQPVWMLDRFDSEWRWLIGRRDSPWYPTLRIYRQPHPGDWEAVLAEVVRDLSVLRAGDRI